MNTRFGADCGFTGVIFREPEVSQHFCITWLPEIRESFRVREPSDTVASLPKLTNQSAGNFMALASVNGGLAKRLGSLPKVANGLTA